MNHTSSLPSNQSACWSTDSAIYGSMCIRIPRYLFRTACWLLMLKSARNWPQNMYTMTASFHGMLLGLSQLTRAASKSYSDCGFMMFSKKTLPYATTTSAREQEAIHRINWGSKNQGNETDRNDKVCVFQNLKGLYWECTCLSFQQTMGCNFLRSICWPCYAQACNVQSLPNSSSVLWSFKVNLNVFSKQFLYCIGLLQVSPRAISYRQEYDTNMIAEQ